MRLSSFSRKVENCIGYQCPITLDRATDKMPQGYSL